MSMMEQQTAYGIGGLTIPDETYVETPSLRLSGYLLVKRCFDFTVALVGCLLTLLPMLLIAVHIKLGSPGPAVIKQERMGQHGKVFWIYKFRTMRMDAPNNVATSLLKNAEQYITPQGRFLRKTSLDELPQLFNVLKGEMSLVGFRPVCLTEKKLNALRQKYGVFAVKPGITGLAQVSGRDDLPYKEKAKVDAQYLRNRSVKMDLYCLLKTIPVATSQKGAR